MRKIVVIQGLDPETLELVKVLKNFSREQITELSRISSISAGSQLRYSDEFEDVVINGELWEYVATSDFGVAEVKETNGYLSMKVDMDTYYYAGNWNLYFRTKFLLPKDKKVDLSYDFAFFIYRSGGGLFSSDYFKLLEFHFKDNSNNRLGKLSLEQTRTDKWYLYAKLYKYNALANNYVEVASATIYSGDTYYNFLATPHLARFIIENDKLTFYFNNNLYLENIAVDTFANKDKKLEFNFEKDPTAIGYYAYWLAELRIDNFKVYF